MAVINVTLQTGGYWTAPADCIVDINGWTSSQSILFLGQSLVASPPISSSSNSVVYYHSYRGLIIARGGLITLRTEYGNITGLVTITGFTLD